MPPQDSAAEPAIGRPMHRWQTSFAAPKRQAPETLQRPSKSARGPARNGIRDAKGYDSNTAEEESDNASRCLKSSNITRITHYEALPISRGTKKTSTFADALKARREKKCRLVPGRYQDSFPRSRSTSRIGGIHGAESSSRPGFISRNLEPLSHETWSAPQLEAGGMINRCSVACKDSLHLSEVKVAKQETLEVLHIATSGKARSSREVALEAKEALGPNVRPTTLAQCHTSAARRRGLLAERNGLTHLSPFGNTSTRRTSTPLAMRPRHKPLDASIPGQRSHQTSSTIAKSSVIVLDDDSDEGDAAHTALSRKSQTEIRPAQFNNTSHHHNHIRSDLSKQSTDTIGTVNEAYMGWKQESKHAVINKIRAKQWSRYHTMELDKPPEEDDEDSAKSRHEHQESDLELLPMGEGPVHASAPSGPPKEPGHLLQYSEQFKKPPPASLSRESFPTREERISRCVDREPATLVLEHSPNPEIENNYNTIRALKDSLAFLKAKQKEKHERDTAVREQVAETIVKPLPDLQKDRKDAALSTAVRVEDQVETVFGTSTLGRNQQLDAKKHMDQAEANRRIKAVLSNVKSSETGLACVASDEARTLMGRGAIVAKKSWRSNGLLDKMRSQACGDAARIQAGKRYDVYTGPAAPSDQSASQKLDNPQVQDRKKEKKEHNPPISPENITPDDWILFKLRNQGWTSRETHEKWPHFSSSRHSLDWVRKRYLRMKRTYPELVPENASKDNEYVDLSNAERNEQIAQRLRSGGSIDDLNNTGSNEKEVARHSEVLAEVRERMPVCHPTTAGKYISPDLAKYMTSFKYDSEDEAEMELDGEVISTIPELSPPAEDDKIHYLYQVHRRTAPPGQPLDDVEWYSCGPDYENVIEANLGASKELRIERGSKVWPLSEFHTKVDTSRTGMASWKGTGANGTVEVKVVRHCKSLEDGVEPTSKADWLKREIYDIFQKRITMDEQVDWAEEEVDETEKIDEDPKSGDDQGDGADGKHNQKDAIRTVRAWSSGECDSQRRVGEQGMEQDDDKDSLFNEFDVEPQASTTNEMRADQLIEKDVSMESLGLDNTRAEQHQKRHEELDQDYDMADISSFSSIGSVETNSTFDLLTPATSFQSGKTSQGGKTDRPADDRDGYIAAQSRKQRPGTIASLTRKTITRTIVRTKVITRTIKTDIRPVGGVYGSRARANHTAGKAYLELMKELDPDPHARRPTLDNVATWNSRSREMDAALEAMDVEQKNLRMVFRGEEHGEIGVTGEMDEMGEHDTETEPQAEIWVMDRTLENPRNL